jgi:Predicted nucleic acid-binding protein, contains PIN domain
MMKMNKPTSCDSSVLINFLRINRIDLLGKCSHTFFITDHVVEEISSLFPAQRACLEFGLEQKILQKINVELPGEFELFTSLNESRQLGAGECAAIAVASHRGYYLTIDDNQAIKKTMGLIGSSQIFRTQDLIVMMIREQILEVAEADHLIEIWATQHRFKLKIKSFSELVISSLY